MKLETDKQRLERMTYTPSEAAEILGIGAQSVRLLCKEPSFPGIPLGKGMIIPKKAFDEWLEDGFFETKKAICSK